MSYSRAGREGANSASPNPLAGFGDSVRGGEKRLEKARKGKGKGRKKETEERGENTPK